MVPAHSEKYLHLISADVARVLLRHGAGANRRDRHGNTALVVAVQNGAAAVVKVRSCSRLVERVVCAFGARGRAGGR